jgi:hypothetical protein
MNERDTSPEAQEVLIDLYRKMPPAVKVRRIFSAYQTGKILAMRGLMLLHSDASIRHIWYLWAKEHLGEELFKQVYGAVPNE